MKIKLILIAALLAGLGACSNQHSEEANMDMTDKSSSNFETPAEESSGNSTGGVDTARKFLRTADVRFEAENVARSTTNIEDVVNSCGGFISLSGLESETYGKETKEISKDSLLEITSYRVISHMVLRVPSTSLDTVLKAIAKEVKFLDSRSIKSDDVSLAMLSNKLAIKRLAKYGNSAKTRVTSSGLAGTTSVDVQDAILDKQEQSDNTQVNQLSLEDQVNYSTVSLEMYQQQQLRKVMIENDRNNDRYEPSIFYRIWDSLVTGWKILENIVVGLLRIWPVILIIVAAVFAIKRYAVKK